MNSVTITGESTTVAQLLERKLKELDRSSAELAEAARVPTEYIDDLIAGRRPPPMPSRTDIYQRMTTFLGLGRNELTSSAQSERKASKEETPLPVSPAVRRLLLGLCNPETVEQLKSKRGKASALRLAALMHRLLNVAQMEVRRILVDPAALRIAAERSGRNSNDERFAVLEFLEATTANLTTGQVERFLSPRISGWDADLDNWVLKVVLKSR